MHIIKSHTYIITNHLPLLDCTSSPNRLNNQTGNDSSAEDDEGEQK
jgi:hypothetical protein